MLVLGAELAENGPAGGCLQLLEPHSPFAACQVPEIDIPALELRFV